MESFSQGCEDLASYAECLDHFLESIPEGKKAIILTGLKGSGKTTLSYPLTELPLKIVKTTTGEQYQPEKKVQPIFITTIEGDKLFLPIIQELKKNKNTYLIDLPYLFDSDNKLRLIGNYAFLAILRKFHTVNFIITSTYLQTKSSQFLDCINFFLKFFSKNKEQLIHNIWLCITKVEAGKTSVEISKNLTKILQQQQGPLQLINFLNQNDKIFLFYRPHQPRFSYSQFTPLLEQQSWQIPNQYKQFMMSLPYDQEIECLSKQYLNNTQQSWKKYFKQFIEIIMQLLQKGSFATKLAIISKIVDQSKYSNVPESPAIAIEQKSENNVIKIMIQSSLKRINDLKSFKVEINKIIDIILDQTNLKENEHQTFHYFSYVLKRKLDQLVFLLYLNKLEFKISQHMKQIQLVVSIKQPQIVIEQRDDIEYYQNMVLTLETMEGNQNNLIIKCYQKMIKLNKDKPEQVYLSFQLLSKLKNDPNLDQVITLYQSIGDLLIKHKQSDQALLFYKAIFKQEKIIKIAEDQNFNHEQFIELGTYFINQGYVNGSAFFYLAMDRTTNVQVKIIIGRYIVEAERKRSQNLRILAERIKNKNFINIIQNPQNILRNISLKPIQPVKWQQKDIEEKLRQVVKNMTLIQQKLKAANIIMT